MTIGFVLLLVMHGSAVPVTDDIYTLEECESRAMQVMAVRNADKIDELSVTLSRQIREAQI
ncbi:hypothetical protein JC861_14325 [Morganella morganii]|uniref:hypothetical protein n=1 Tax=Morganella morganii TaxID=582 RepID=UPI001C487919|nr:hypothetical protein [Morganella morganii]QXO49015.1 hypothetical protein JC861_14325 [Morganella morganii]QXO52870.1 hypothetical protein JC830_14290 [Morganella morganii]